MKRILYKDYDQSMGKLIDVEDEKNFQKEHLPEAINIPFEKMLGNFKKILNKDESYYFYCKQGHKSKKVCNILEYYGYDVTQVIN